jgi:hypothetical protein
MSEPEGHGVAWTEERGTSDEGLKDNVVVTMKLSGGQNGDV